MSDSREMVRPQERNKKTASELTTFAYSRMKSRSSLGVSPSNVATVTRSSPSTPATSSPSARFWSCASAFVGNTYSAVASRSRSSASTTGTWYTSDLPDEVEVLMITLRLAASALIARAWCEYNRAQSIDFVSYRAEASASDSGRSSSPGRDPIEYYEDRET